MSGFVPIPPEDADLEVTLALPLEQALDMIGKWVVYETGDGVRITRHVVDIMPTNDDALSWDLVLEKP